MAIFAAHCAPEFPRSNASLERAHVYRLGFVWPALLFGPLWLLAKRLWMTLALWILAAVLAGVATAHGLLAPDALFWLYVLSALYLGVEGRAFEAAAQTRRGRPLADILCAADRLTAERAFFARVAPEPPRPPAPPPRSGPPGAPPPVIGLFPEAGGSR